MGAAEIMASIFGVEGAPGGAHREMRLKEATSGTGVSHLSLASAVHPSTPGG